MNGVVLPVSLTMVLAWSGLPSMAICQECSGVGCWRPCFAGTVTFIGPSTGGAKWTKLIRDRGGPELSRCSPPCHGPKRGQANSASVSQGRAAHSQFKHSYADGIAHAARDRLGGLSRRGGRFGACGAGQFHPIWLGLWFWIAWAWRTTVFRPIPLRGAHVLLIACDVWRGIACWLKPQKCRLYSDVEVQDSMALRVDLVWIVIFTWSI